MTRDQYRITCVRRHPVHHYWTAHVTVDGHTIPVDRKYGSWRVTRSLTSAHVLPEIAAALQDRVRKLERAERRDGTRDLPVPGAQLEMAS